MLNNNKVGISFLDNRYDILNYGYQNEYVTDLIRESLLSAGLGNVDINAPLKDIIESGMTVLLKPNWVHHENLSGMGRDCLITHEIFLEAVTKEVIKCCPKFIIIGDSPIQGCDFQQISDWSWVDRIRRTTEIPIIVKDYRRTVMRRNPITQKSKIYEDIQPIENYCLFNLRRNSWLEPITDEEDKFRVADYNHRFLNPNHKSGVHNYLFVKDPFEVDVVINLPKLKTHQKAGMTGAIKNLVGLNGNKDYLPHHRFGDKSYGGDCYKDKSVLRHLLEITNDLANQHLNKNSYMLLKNASRALSLIGRILGIDTSVQGSWSGNDTVWRMALDLNIIATYGDKFGNLSLEPQRNIYTITDGIIAGQNDGPLSPEPIILGVVTFSNSSPYLDFVHCYLMGLNPLKIPMVREALATNPEFPLINSTQLEIVLNGKKVHEDDLKAISLRFKPAKGWVGAIEN